MLKLLFSALDAHPFLYWVILAIPSAALVVTVAKSFWWQHSIARAAQQDLWFLSWSLIFVFAWRWPALLESHEFNPDESQLIAGALTLVHDPVFWRSVDGTTSGPLNFYALLPLHALGLPLDYFTARLTGLLLLSVTLIACYRLLRTHGSAAAAQLALLPLLAFLATTTDPFFLQYSSGDVSLTLFAVAAYGLFSRPPSGSAGRNRLLLGGFTAGLLPWAKLQTLPLAAALVGSCVWFMIARGVGTSPQKCRRGVTVLLAAVLPSVVGVTAVAMSGQMESFIQGYFRQNFVYVDGGVSLGQALKGMWGFTAKTGAFPAFVGASLLLLLTGTSLYLWLRRRPGSFFMASAAWSIAAAFCIIVPRRPYAHYLLLATVPVALWTGAALTEIWPSLRSRRRFGLTVLAMGCLLPLAVRLLLPPPAPFGRFSDNWRHPYSLPGTLLRSCSVPGDSVAVWGWRTDLYVDAQLRQATRDPHTVWSLVPTKHRDYYRARYLADLQRSRPEFFVDAVGPGAVFYQDRRELAHEVFPALDEYLQRGYVLLAELQSERIYARSDVRNDPRRDFSQAALRKIVAKARADAKEEVDAPAPTTISPPTLGIWDLKGHNVRMLLPPARLTWVLDGTEREAAISFGVHPRAYLEGKTNGADLIMELEVPGSPTLTLFQRHLDPVKQPEDRVILSAHALLPQSSAGARLVIRTEPGAYGDQAWDWVYLDALRYVRSWAREFPGFEKFESVPPAVH